MTHAHLSSPHNVQDKTEWQYPPSQEWVWQFNSDWARFGLGFASRRAHKKGVPISMTLAHVRRSFHG